MVAAAFQSFEGHEPHPEPFDKAAVLLRGVTQSHPFEDGNKRTGFWLAMFYLANVGVAPPDPLPEDDVVRFCERLSAGGIRDLDDIKRELLRIYGLDLAGGV
jgi:prophage maintenance system killer protein